MINLIVPLLGNSNPEHPETPNALKVPLIPPIAPEHNSNEYHTLSVRSTHNPKKLYWMSTRLYSFSLFLITAVPMFSLFAAHECSSIGYFLVPSLHCAGAAQFSPNSPVWSHIVLVMYYYFLSKYGTMIES
jgi:hypothetical protein